MVLGIYVTFLDAFGPKFWVEVGCLPIHHCRHNSRKCHHWRDHWVSTKENFYWKERFLVMISRNIRPCHFPSLKLEQKERSWVLYFLSKGGWGWLILTSSYVLRVMSTLKILEPPFHSHVVNFILSLELVKVRLSVFENSPEMSHFNFHDKNRQKSCRINLCQFDMLFL